MRAGSLAGAALVAILAMPATASAADPPSVELTPPPMDPSMWAAQRLPPYAPATLPYVPGMPMPPGYVVASRRRLALAAAGAAVFGVGFVSACLTAATVVLGPNKHRSEVAPLFIPLGGPFVTLETSRDVQLADPDRRTNGALLLVNGGAQVAGLIMFIVGMATREPMLARTKESYAHDEARLAPEIVVGDRGAALRWQL